MPPHFEIKEGFVSQKADTIRIERDKETVAVVILSEPKMLAQAEREEPWGYFQFPAIYRDEKTGDLIVTWSMMADSYETYGEGSSGLITSRDEGQSWQFHDRNVTAVGKYGVRLKNGNFIEVKTPSTKNIGNYENFPSPVSNEAVNGYKFYHEYALPEELRGVYFEKWNRQEDKFSIMHAQLNDPGYLRYAIWDNMPVQW